MDVRNKAVLIECPICHVKVAAMDTDDEYVCTCTDSVYHKDNVDDSNYNFRRLDDVSNVHPTIDVETNIVRYDRQPTKITRR